MKKIVFFPICESHDDNFSLLVNKFETDTSVQCQYLYIESANTRKFSPKIHEKKIIRIDTGTCYKRNKESLHFVFSANPAGLLVVGNDASLQVRNVIRIARKHKFRTVLLQDGWLRSQSLNKPIKSQMSTLKYYLKRVIAHKYSPIERYFHGFIGHWADFHFVYSDMAKKEFLKAGFKGNQVFVTGSPRHHVLKYQKNKKSVGNNYLFLLPSFFNADNQNYIDLQNNYYNVLNCLKKRHADHFNIYIKPHPRESINFFENLRDKNVRLIRDSLSKVIGVVHFKCAFAMINSTAILEMLVAGIPTIQYFTKSRPRSICNYPNYIPIVESQEDICEALLNINIEDREIERIIADHSTSHNSVITVNELLKDLLNEH